MAKYISCGNLVSDSVRSVDGVLSKPNMGGGGIFAMAGIRLWTDSCKLVCHAGEDYYETYGKWMEDNGLTNDGVMIDVEKTNSSILTHRSDGTYFQENPLGPRKGAENFGYLQVKPRELENLVESDTLGIYMTQNCDKVRWKNLLELKKKTNVKIMWELQLFDQTLEQVMAVIDKADMFSINKFEASKLYDIDPDNEEELIKQLQQLPVEMVFFRVGKKGAYVLADGKEAFCPSVDPLGPSKDPTGCGNCSTGAAMYAWLEGKDPLMTAIMANISSGYNAAQYGVYPIFDKSTMKEAKDLAIKIYEERKAANEL